MNMEQKLPITDIDLKEDLVELMIDVYALAEIITNQTQFTEFVKSSTKKTQKSVTFLKFHKYFHC